MNDATPAVGDKIEGKPREPMETMKNAMEDNQQKDEEGKEEIILPSEIKKDKETGVKMKSETKGTRRSIGIYEIYLFAFLLFVALPSGMMKNHREKNLNAEKDNQNFQVRTSNFCWFRKGV